MLSFISLALLLPLGALSRPLALVHKTTFASCVIADIDYPNPHETLMLLHRRAVTPPPGLSKRTFTDLLIWCHEFGHSTGSMLLARQNPSCPAGTRNGAGGGNAASAVGGPNGATTSSVSGNDDPRVNDSPASSGPDSGPGTSTTSSSSSGSAATGVNNSVSPSGPGSDASNKTTSGSPGSGSGSGQGASSSGATGPASSDSGAAPPGSGTTGAASSGSRVRVASNQRVSNSGATDPPSSASNPSVTPTTTPTSAAPSITTTTTTTSAAFVTPGITACPPGQTASVFATVTIGGLASGVICVAI